MADGKRKISARRAGRARPKRLDIQALRALAVVAVVVYHLWPGRLAGGFVGVDIFFVISGFLMTGTILRQIKRAGIFGRHERGRKLAKSIGGFFAGFYARRIRRLAPSALVVLALILGVVVLSGNFATISTTAAQVLASATFWQNWKLAALGADYLGANTNATALQHFWSLSVEEQFYLIWPALMLAVVSLGAVLTILWKKRKVNGGIVIAILFTAGFFAYGWWLTGSNAAAAYLVTPARIWELGLGAVVALLPELKRPELKLLLPWGGLVLCLVAIFTFTGADFPGWRALVPTLGATLVIYGGGTGAFSFARATRFRPIQALGNTSYSLYLYHWPMIALVPLFIGGVTLTWPIKLAILAVSLVLAGLSYKFVEIPFQKGKIGEKLWPIVKPWRVYLVGGIAVAAVAVGAWRIGAWADYKSAHGVAEIYAAASDDANPIGARALDENGAAAFGKLNKNDIQFAESDVDMAVKDGCGVWAEPKTMDTECVLGDKNASQYLLLWGDSHAMHFSDALDTAAKKLHYKIIVKTYNSCPPFAMNAGEAATLISYNKSDPVYSENCIKVNKKIRASELYRDADAVIFASAYFERPPAYDFMAKNFAADFNDAKPKIFIKDVPAITYPADMTDANKAVEMMNAGRTSVARADVTDDTEFFARLRKTGIKFAEIDTTERFCDAEKCYLAVGGLPIYRNDEHMTGSYSRTLGLWMVGELRSALKADGRAIIKS